MSSPHLQESRGFPQFSVGRKGDVSYCEEELKGFHYLVSSHMQPCPCLLKHSPGVYHPVRVCRGQVLISPPHSNHKHHPEITQCAHTAARGDLSSLSSPS